MANRLSHHDFDACSRALQELYAPSSLTEFPKLLLPLLMKVVPSGHVSYNDFNERRGRFIIHHQPERSEAKKLLPQFAANFPTHPLYEHYQQAGLFPKKISDITTLRQFTETPIYQEYYRQVDTRHQMIFFLHHQRDSRIGLALNRWEKDFSERDRSVLAFLSPHIAQAYKNARTADLMAFKLETVGEGLDVMRRAVVLAGADGKIHWQSSLAREWLQEFFPDSTHTSERLPHALANWLSQIEKSAQAGRPAFSELQLPTSNNCRLLVYCGKTNGEYVMALMRERMEIDSTAAQQFGLTPREAEILFWISEAKTRPEMGAILNVSWRTVAKHMEHIFTKLGVENRLEAQRIGLELRKT
jgi:DNA-binding CsgD family transcriptional regulator